MTVTKKSITALTLMALSMNSMWASTASAQAQAANPETLSCLSKPLGSSDYVWTFQVAQDLNQKKIDARMGFDALKQTIELNKQVRDAVKDALMKSLGQTAQSIGPETFLKPGFNAQTEIMNVINRFNENLRAQLLNGLKVDQETNLQIMIAPELSAEAKAAKNSAYKEIPYQPYYPADRLTVYNNMAESDSAFKSAEEVVKTNVYQGIGQYLQDVYECKVQKPVFTVAIINVKAMPNPSDSTLSAQITLAMPTNLELPFEQANDQVQFSKIAFPTVDLKAMNNMAGLRIDAASYPVALITMNQKIVDNSDIPVLIEFGPLGTYTNNKWVRAANQNFNKLVPKLKATAVGSNIKKEIAIDFNIYNLTMSLQKQQVTDLDIFLSVGLRRFPNFKVGRINRTDVDTQFQSEINKEIQKNIEAQKAQLAKYQQANLSEAEKAKIVEAAVKMGAPQGIPPEMTKELVQALFSAIPKK